MPWWVINDPAGVTADVVALPAEVNSGSEGAPLAILPTSATPAEVISGNDGDPLACF